jgi:hypothetical protein
MVNKNTELERKRGPGEREKKADKNQGHFSPGKKFEGRAESEVMEERTSRGNAKIKYRKLETNIPRNGIARPQSQFPHSPIYKFPCRIGLSILLQEKMWTDPGNI